MARAGATGRRIVLWSGPWGWALQPVAGATAASLLALALLAARDRRSPSRPPRAASSPARPSATPCAPRRAAERVASAWALDARTARLSLRRAAGPARRRARRSLRAPRRPELAIPWRDATSALRAPQRTLGQRRAGGRAAAVAIAAADRPAAEAVAALGSYVAASTLLEPLRVEIDRPSASRVLLRRPFGRILLGHVAVPIAVMAAGAAVAAIGLAVAGALPARGGALALVAIAVGPDHRPLRGVVLAPRRPRAGERPRHGLGRRPVRRRDRGRLAAGVAGRRDGAGRRAADLRRARDVAVERRRLRLRRALAAPFALGAVLANSEA